MKIKHKILSIISICSLLVMMTASEAALKNIVIDGGQVDGIPIAISSFVSADVNHIEDIAQIIRKDLQSSGQFKVLTENTGAQDIVSGRIEKTSSGYNVKFELIDALGPKNRNTLLAMQFDQVKGGELRALAHHISDLVFEKLIGMKGIFSTRIAYVTTSENLKDRVFTLEVADSDGHNPRTLYRSNASIYSLTWSPDGHKIAFVSLENERNNIKMVNVLNGKVEQIAKFPGMNNAPTFSPDGRTLAMVLSKDGNPKIYTIDLSSRQVTRLTDGPGDDTEPCFSPDGRSIIFNSNRGGKPQIYRVTLGTRQVERLTFTGTYNAKPSLTPDGKNLVTLHRGDAGGLFSIAVHNLDTGRVKVLTQTGLNDSPTLAPNGMMVIYGSEEGGRGVLSAVTLDGRLKMRLPAQSGNVQEPAWSPFLGS